jgi:hypothetical protein
MSIEGAPLPVSAKRAELQNQDPEVVRLDVQSQLLGAVPQKQRVED